MTTKNTYYIGKFSSLAIFGLALFSAHARAQTAASSTPDLPSGLLGVNYATFNTHVTETNSASGNPTTWGPNIGVNYNICHDLDIGATYGYNYGSGTAVKIDNNNVDVNLFGYYPLPGVTPFLRAGLGYAWNRSERSGKNFTTNGATYNFGTGVEAPLASGLSMRMTVGYAENFQSPHGHSWNWGPSANYWLSSAWSLDAAVTFSYPMNSKFNQVQYLAGAHYAF